MYGRVVAGNFELEGHGGTAGRRGGKGRRAGSERGGAVGGMGAVDNGHNSFLGDKLLLLLFLQEQLLVVVALLALKLELELDTSFMLDLVARGLGWWWRRDGEVTGGGTMMKILDGAKMYLRILEDHAMAVAGL
jgi:hypothetical protein